MKRSPYLILVPAFILAAAGGFFLSAPHAEAAFGISPPFINASHLVPGITYSQTLYLVRDDASSGLPVTESLTIPQAVQGWVSLDQPANFTIPTDTRQFPVTVTIKVPSGAADGTYNGNLSFTTMPNQNGEVSVALGVNVALNLTVGSDTFEQYSVPLINILDIEEGWNPKVYVKFDNQGNVPEAFDGATFELYDQYDSVRLAYLQLQSGFPSTPAFTTKDYTVEFPSDFHLGVGSYWGNVTFYKNGNPVASQKMAFRVLPAGTLSGWWGLVSYKIESNIWSIVAAIAIIVAAILFIVRRRHRAYGG